MNFELYIKLANVLQLLKAGAPLKKRPGEDDGFDEERDFYARYKRRIVHNNNRNLPMYELMYGDNNEPEMVKNGVPRIVFHTHDRKSHALKSTRDLLYKERLQDILESLHYFDEDGSRMCHPGKQIH